MPTRREMFNIEDVQWHEDLALFRSLDGEVPWAQRFGQGRVKVLQFDPANKSGTYLLHWPADYDPLGEHGHGGNCTELVLSGSLVDGEREWASGSFIYTPLGQQHGPLRAGPEGCLLLVHVDGPLFDQAFLHALMEHGKAARFRV